MGHFSFLNKISLFQKIIILMLGSILIPFSLQTVFFYRQLETELENSISSKLEMAMEDKADKLKGYVTASVSLSRLYGRQEILYRLLDTKYESELGYWEIYQTQVKNIFENKTPYYLQVKNTVIYTDNQSVLNGPYIQKRDMVFLENPETVEEFLNTTTVDGGSYLVKDGKDWLLFRNTREKENEAFAEERVVSVYAPMDYYAKYDNYRKLLRLDLNLSYLRNVLSENNMFDNMVLTDMDGRIILAANNYRQNGEFEYFNINEYGRNTLIFEQDIKDYPFVLYGIYYTDGVRKEMTGNLWKCLAIEMLGFGIAVCFVTIIFGNITGRIRKMVEQSERVASEDFSPMIYDENGKDEISVLERGMNQMGSRLEVLIQEKYQDELNRARLEQEVTNAKLLALQSQINPHFMFNALESIRLRAAAKGEKETSQMIRNMSRMFRKLITWDHNIITLQEEIDFLDEFLNLQKYRFEDEFSYTITVEKETSDCLIPKMIVQQLVENACVHGVEAIANDRFVFVTSYLEQEKLVLVVKDNGGGISDEKLNQLKAMMHGESEQGMCVGLYNIYRRLTLYYGEDFSFELQSELGKGTTCIIKILAERG